MLMQGEQPNLLPMIGAAQDFVLRVTAPVDEEGPGTDRFANAD
jgi:hypothetical protein